MTDGSLSLWHDGVVKTRIQKFVTESAHAGGPSYIAPGDRIAVFDNDGTLWVEQPMYTQLRFALDRLRVLAPAHPEWAEEPVLQAALRDDLSALAQFGMAGLETLLAVTHTGLTTDALAETVRDWIASARHPRFDRLYTELIYAPQLQLIHFLRAHDYRVYIVSGGGVEFMRAWAEGIYGTPPEQVIGSSARTRYELQDGRGVLVHLPAIDLVDDGPGKPMGINKFIGRRPVIAVGNSDGDLEMLQYTTTGDGPRLAIYVHHDDANREYAYDRASIFGRLDAGLAEAAARGWIVVSIQRDWKAIFVDE